MCCKPFKRKSLLLQEKVDEENFPLSQIFKMIFLTVRLFDATGSYASPEQQERLKSNGYKTKNFDRKIDEVENRWEKFWYISNRLGHRKNSLAINRWTIEISGLDERFSASFLEKFGTSNQYPRTPLKSADDLSYYVTIGTDPNLARDGQIMPISVAAFYINILEQTGLKCNYTKHISPSDGDSSSPSNSSMIWTLAEWR